ncbi:MAG: pyruvate dehydrogenase (acetyl-transferring) E1 component subunit alpha [Verrucomicrobiales bacterium]|nr:pyruvate dehydrogenase (acetyl-transferring) E1 component subunit alpha [Verrucomicrobiales bacterium]
MSQTAASPQTVADPTDFASYRINQTLDAERKIFLFREMVRIRRFEEASGKYYAMGKMGGFLHRYDGQEAIAVGCASLMGPNDHMITAYRDHGHALAAGMGMNECMAELFGKATGCSKGKGGSMHFFAPEKNYWGGHGIVGAQTPLGTGIAFYLKHHGITGSCMTFLGDGAVNQGCFHESLNLAGLLDLPVIFVIENNGYSMGTSQARSSAYKNCLAYRADGYDIIWDLIHGWDLYEVRAKMQIAITRAHEEKRPTVVEIQTYRYYGHSVADANAKKYRTEEEINSYKTGHDPIQLWKNRLIEEGVVTEEACKEIDKAAKKEAEDAARFADESPFPEPADIMKDVYWEVDQDTISGRTGRHFFGGD